MVRLHWVAEVDPGEVVVQVTLQGPAAQVVTVAWELVAVAVAVVSLVGSVVEVDEAKSL